MPQQSRSYNFISEQIKMIALNEPMNGNMHGIRGADYACYRQAARAGLPGVYKAFLNSRYIFPFRIVFLNWATNRFISRVYTAERNVCNHCCRAHLANFRWQIFGAKFYSTHGTVSSTITEKCRTSHRAFSVLVDATSSPIERGKRNGIRT